MTSTASSIAESNDTVAAEWTKISHAASAGASRIVEPEPIGAHVPRDHRDPPGDVLVEAFAEQLAQMVEGVVAQDLPLHALRGRGAAATPHEQHQGAIGHGSQQPFDDGGAEKPRRARDRDGASGQCLPDHRALSTIW